jgi:hypothetical protein
MTDKKVVLTVPSYRTSELGFTVTCRQEYGLQVAVHTGETYIVFKRYSELLKLQGRLASISRTLGVTLPEFPPKKLNSLQVAVIDRRLAMLEVWLQEVFNNPSLLTYAIPFLELPEYLVFLVESEVGCSHLCKLNDAEMQVLSFLEFITTCELNRMCVVNSFRKALLSSVSSLCKDIFCLLLRFLLQMTTDKELSSSAVKFLLKLMKHHKYAELCITELLDLDIDLLKAMELNRLLLQEASNGTVFEILCILKRRLSKDMRSSVMVSIVSPRQLNGDSYALRTFIHEYLKRFVNL